MTSYNVLQVDQSAPRHAARDVATSLNGQIKTHLDNEASTGTASGSFWLIKYIIKQFWHLNNQHNNATVLKHIRDSILVRRHVAAHKDTPLDGMARWSVHFLYKSWSVHFHSDNRS